MEKLNNREVLMPEKYGMPYNMDLFLLLRTRYREVRKVVLKEIDLAKKLFGNNPITFKEFKKMDPGGFAEWRNAIFREAAFSQIILNGYLNGDELYDDLYLRYGDEVERSDISSVVSEIEAWIENKYKNEFKGAVKRESNEFPTFLGLVMDLQKEYSVLDSMLTEYGNVRTDLSEEDRKTQGEELFGNASDVELAPYRKAAYSLVLFEGVLDNTRIEISIKMDAEAKGEKIETKKELIEKVVKEIKEKRETYQESERLFGDSKEVGGWIDKLFKNKETKKRVDE